MWNVIRDEDLISSDQIYHPQAFAKVPQLQLLFLVAEDVHAEAILIYGIKFNVFGIA